ncbi:MAG: ATP-dependent helicase HrpB [Candidatus Latescibacterota bacterium]
MKLPIFEIEKDIVSHLKAHNRLVLTAPTGSGKTTQVPQILLKHNVVQGEIWVLQPRRLATRMVALRVASEVGEGIGQTVGYHTRHDRQLGEKTRLLFMTEGIFLRRLHNNPTLLGVGAVILDEFHERSLDADVALGLLRRLQEETRADLRLMVMSATLDAKGVSLALDCSLLQAGGRAFPVDIFYVDREPSAQVWDLAAERLRAVLDQNESGDVLIFMPGIYEIQRTLTACRSVVKQGDAVSFFPLHGSLSVREQDAVLAPCDTRKVIVATNVAETSLTIDGIRHVIDGGLVRVQRFDIRRGINVLLVEGISQASADQRSGRAGRTAPGTCWRLWTETAHYAKPQQTDPEVKRLDLADAVLRLKALGVKDVVRFSWLDRPTDDAFDRALDLLVHLEALTATGNLTPIGQQMALIPAHPRLGRLLVAAAQYGCVERAALWAALIGERDILSRPIHKQYTLVPDGDVVSDLVIRENAFELSKRLRFDPRACLNEGIVASACRDVDRARDQFLSACKEATIHQRGRGDTVDLVRCLLAGFFDHVALRRDRDSRSCVMADLRRVELDRESVAEPGLIVALDTREVTTKEGVRTVLSLASNVLPEWLEEVHPNRIVLASEAVWNADNKAVEQVETHAYQGLVYRRIARPNADPVLAAEILVDRIVSGEIDLAKWDEEVDHWMVRTRCVGQWFPERGLIAYDEDDVRVILYEIVDGATRHSQIRNRPILPYVKQALSWADQQFVEQMTPTRIVLLKGFGMKIRYQADGPPVGAAKIQDFYDLPKTPTVAGGRQKVLLEILAPNFRPAQVTDDLEGFWERTYPELKKELRRRYPKHEWR